MLNDLVLDTNVLVNAGDPKSDKFNDSNSFLISLLQNGTILCVDKGFNMSETTNSSLIFREYRDKLRFGSIGLNLIGKLNSSHRIVGLEKKPKDTGAKNLIEQKIRKKRDRVFVGVAYHSVDKILVSHDFEDFQVNKRVFFKSKLGVEIILALDAEQKMI